MSAKLTMIEVRDLLGSLLKMADRHGSSTISITNARARTLIATLDAEIKSLEKPSSKMDSKLDSYFGFDK